MVVNKSKDLTKENTDLAKKFLGKINKAKDEKELERVVDGKVDGILSVIHKQGGKLQKKIVDGSKQLLKAVNWKAADAQGVLFTTFQVYGHGAVALRLFYVMADIAKKEGMNLKPGSLSAKDLTKLKQEALACCSRFIWGHSIRKKKSGSRNGPTGSSSSSTQNEGETENVDPVQKAYLEGSIGVINKMVREHIVPLGEQLSHLYNQYGGAGAGSTFANIVAIFAQIEDNMFLLGAHNAEKFYKTYYPVLEAARDDVTKAQTELGKLYAKFKKTGHLSEEEMRRFRAYTHEFIEATMDFINSVGKAVELLGPLAVQENASDVAKQTISTLTKYFVDGLMIYGGISLGRLGLSALKGLRSEALLEQIAAQPTLLKKIGVVGVPALTNGIKYSIYGGIIGSLYGGGSALYRHFEGTTFNPYFKKFAAAVKKKDKEGAVAILEKLNQLYIKEMANIKTRLGYVPKRLQVLYKAYNAAMKNLASDSVDWGEITHAAFEAAVYGAAIGAFVGVASGVASTAAAAEASAARAAAESTKPTGGAGAAEGAAESTKPTSAGRKPAAPEERAAPVAAKKGTRGAAETGEGTKPAEAAEATPEKKLPPKPRPYKELKAIRDRIDEKVRSVVKEGEKSPKRFPMGKDAINIRQRFALGKRLIKVYNKEINALRNELNKLERLYADGSNPKAVAEVESKIADLRMRINALKDEANLIHNRIAQDLKLLDKDPELAMDVAKQSDFKGKVDAAKKGFEDLEAKYRGAESQVSSAANDVEALQSEVLNRIKGKLPVLDAEGNIKEYVKPKVAADKKYKPIYNDEGDLIGYELPRKVKVGEVINKINEVVEQGVEKVKMGAKKGEEWVFEGGRWVKKVGAGARNVAGKIVEQAEAGAKKVGNKVVEGADKVKKVANNLKEKVKKKPGEGLGPEAHAPDLVVNKSSLMYVYDLLRTVNRAFDKILFELKNGKVTEITDTTYSVDNAEVALKNTEALYKRYTQLLEKAKKNATVEGEIEEITAFQENVLPIRTQLEKLKGYFDKLKMISAEDKARFKSLKKLVNNLLKGLKAVKPPSAE